MITLIAQPGINHAAFSAAMHSRNPDWRNNVQICHVAQRTRDGGKHIAIRINPLRGYRLAADAEKQAQEALAEVSA
jgi:hypothetical protein